MAKINIVVGDTDEFYLTKIVNYMIEHSNNFEVQSFTLKDRMLAYIGDPSNKIDIVAVSESMMDDRISSSTVPTKILLHDESYVDVSGYDVVNKYQKAENFINQILMIYAEKTGRLDAIATGSKNTMVVGFYSPVGGGGKTTLALASACALGKKGKRVIYLNLEKINSVAGIVSAFPSGSMSDIFLAKKTRGANVGIKIMANKQQSPMTGVNFINPAESSLELNELSHEEITGLIKDFDVLGEFDYVIVDFDSELNNEKMLELSACDKIVAPFTPEQISVTKMTNFLREAGMREELAEIKRKMLIVLNKVAPNISMPQLPENERMITVASSPAFSDLRSALNAPELIVPAVEELVMLL